MKSKRALGLAFAVVAVFMSVGVGGEPAHASRTVRSDGLSETDAPFYLDVRDGLPPQFRQLSDTEMQEFGAEPIPEVRSVAYVDDESGTALLLNLTIGHGRSSQLSFREHVAQVDRTYRANDFKALLADADVPADQVSVTTSEWTDVPVGDAARSALFSVDVAGEDTGHVDVLVMAVSRGRDAALVQVMQIFGLSTAVDTSDIARVVAGRVHDGPPSAGEAIGAAGLITLTDLPAGWEEDRSRSSGAPTPSETSNATPTHQDGVALIGRFARHLPECKTFVKVMDAAAGETTDRAATPNDDKAPLHGAHFVRGADKVTSQVTVYPSAAAAGSYFDFVRDPSIKQCLSKLYSSVVNTAAQTAARNAPRTLTPTTKVTTPHVSVVGDDRVLFRITVGVKELPSVRFLFEQEFIRADRAVAAYTFSTRGADTIRENVLPHVAARLAAAQ